MHCRALLILALVTLALPAALTPPAAACTSFMLETDDGLYFAHSLNHGGLDAVNGGVYINPRGLWKRGYDMPTMMGGTPDAGPTLIWKACYGSVTFSPLGRENPDGGMNEAGLFIFEKGYDPVYSTDPTLPVLFQMQWMQYQLDNYSTVEEVVANADRIALDGWGWHYFVADATGDAAIIDYVDGKAEVYRGESLPYPICCNSNYEYALGFLSQHEGFGGDIPIEQNFDETPRFIYGAKLLVEHEDEEPAQYCLDMLDGMSMYVRWAVVFDLERSTVHFRTDVNREDRSFSFSPADFEQDAGTLMFDVNAAGAGDVRSMFEPYDADIEAEFLADVLNLFMEDEAKAAAAGEAHAARLEYVDLAELYEIEGAWTGTVTVSVQGEEKSLSVALNLEESGGVYTGTIDGEAFGKQLPLHNIAFRGGLLAFTSRDPESGELIRYQLYQRGTELKGGAWTWDWRNRKTASITLTRG